MVEIVRRCGPEGRKYQQLPGRGGGRNEGFHALWDQLFNAKQARIIQLLVRRVTVTTAGLEVGLRKEGIAGVICDMVICDMVTPRRL
jgi:hypothetical protein